MSVRDLTNQRFGRLVAKRVAYIKHMAYWECVCDCGGACIVCGTNLTRGHTYSCGCLRRDNFHKLITKHGDARSKLYNVWQAMRRRCFDPRTNSYQNYGARGITVCEEWVTSYKCFRDWALNNGYKDGLTIDRINNDGNYCAGNCRWATRAQQNNNKRKTIKIKYKNKTQTITEWAKELGLNRSALYSRIRSYGWPIDKALSITTGEKNVSNL